MNTELQTISWDNSNIYISFKDPQILKDLNKIQKNIDELNLKNVFFENYLLLISDQTVQSISTFNESIPLACANYRLNLDTSILIHTLHTYARTALSVNSLHSDAKSLIAQAEQLLASLKQANMPLQLFLIRAPKKYLEAFLNNDSVNEIKFTIEHARKKEDFLLTISEEKILEGFSIEGFHSWARLYTELSGSLIIDIEGQKMGLAQASNILFQSDKNHRKAAYRAINVAWEQHQNSAAAILNSLTGWRLENNRVRSKKREMHYLDESCHEQNISRKTLETLIQTTYENRHIGHQALKLMALENGNSKLEPWDLLAPAPIKSNTSLISFPEAMDIITSAFQIFSPDMADFAKIMQNQCWIDATPSNNRASGAYCTYFERVREPRVFLTYDGSLKNLITLAHELGHAYHHWVMTDLKLSQTHYSACLAETASIFAETLVKDFLIENSKTHEEKKSILWQELESAATLLINIPARFEFERQMYQQRQHKTLSAADLKIINNQAWQYWYEDTLTEYNEMFWASKLHFSKSRISFYNYPYLFGYLFSLGIYAKKNIEKVNFKKIYIDVLRDTGSMTAENLIQKHFNEDISEKSYWLNSLKIVEKSVVAYSNSL